MDKDILLTKLMNYGIDQNNFGWFTDYFTNQYQSVKMGSCVSKQLKVKCSVPQG